MAAITISSDFGAPQNKVRHCFHCFSIYLPRSDGTRCHDLFLSPLSHIKRLFSCSSLSAIRVVSSTYLRLLIFLPAILISACASSSQAFCMMYSVYKLSKQGDNIQPFPIWNFDVFFSQFIGRPDAKAEAPVLWPPDAKSQHIGKDPDAGKD